MRFRVFFILLSILICGCSIYQSESRKFLEKQAFEYAGVAAQANLLGCPGDIASADWNLSAQNEDARVFVNDAADFEMLVTANKGDNTFKCSFRFNSAQEMVEKTDDAIALTLHFQESPDQVP